MEYKDKIFVLKGHEGGEFRDLYVDTGYDPLDGFYSINYFVKVVGFIDKRCPERNWGRKHGGSFKEEPVIKYKTLVKYRIRKPKTRIERMLAKFGFYKKYGI